MEKKPTLRKQDRPSVPDAPRIPPAPPQRRRDDVWDKLHGNQVVVQEKGGTMIIGLFTKIECGFIKLKNAIIIGRNSTVHVERVWIDRNTIAHMHEQVSIVNESKQSK